MRKRNLLVSVLSTGVVILSSTSIFAAQTGTLKDLPADTKDAILKSIQTNGTTSDITSNSKINLTLKSSDAAEAKKDSLPTSIGITSNTQLDQETGNAKGDFTVNMALTGAAKPLNVAASYQFEGIKKIDSALFYLKLSNIQIPQELFKNDPGSAQSINAFLPMLKSSWLKVDFQKLVALDPAIKKSISEASAQIADLASGKTTIDSNLLAMGQKLLDEATYTTDGKTTTLDLKIPKSSPVIKQFLTSNEFKSYLNSYFDKLKATVGDELSKDPTIADINKAIASSKLNFGDIAYKIELSNNNQNIHAIASVPFSVVDSQTEKVVSSYKNVKSVSGYTTVKKIVGYKTVKVKGKNVKQPVYKNVKQPKYKTTKQPLYKNVTKNTTYSINVSVDTTTTLGDVTVSKLDASSAIDVLDMAKSLTGK